MRVPEKTRRSWRGADGLLLTSWEIGLWGGATEIDVAASGAKARPDRMVVLGEREWALDPDRARSFEGLWADQDHALGGQGPDGTIERMGGRALIASNKRIESLWARGIERFGRVYANAMRSHFDSAAQGLGAKQPSSKGPAFALSLFDLGQGMSALIAHHSLHSYTGLLSEPEDRLEDKDPWVKSFLFGRTRGAVRSRLEVGLAEKALAELKARARGGEGEEAEGVSAIEALWRMDRRFGFEMDRLISQGSLSDPDGERARAILACRALGERETLEASARAGVGARGPRL